MVALTFVASLALLLSGAELFVRGGGRVALALRVPIEVVAMTVVAVGTSLPEILVAVTAAFEGQPALALGSVVGTHVAGLALVLGLAALRSPLVSDARLLRREVPAILVLQAATGGLAVDGELGRLDGVVLLAIGGLYAAVLARDARAGRVTPERRRPDRRADPLASGAMVLLGLALAVGGAELLVSAAGGAVVATGLSPRVVGLTLVALVTTAPEIAAALANAWQDEVELALPHALGASVLAWSIALGGTALLKPIAVVGATAYEDLAVGVVATLLLVPMMLGGPRLTRPEGAVLVGLWLLWTAWLVGGLR